MNVDLPPMFGPANGQVEPQWTDTSKKYHQRYVLMIWNSLSSTK
jgi:hypothetical protein